MPGRVITIGISDYAVSRDSDDTLTTHALGSCIAVAIHDPVARVSGLLHLLLPDSTLNGQRNQERPCMYADTGIPRLFHRAYELGADKSRLLVVVIGGAQVIGGQEGFNIGKLNYLATRRILKDAGVSLAAEEVGGTLPRSVRMKVGSGRIILSCDRREQVLQLGHGEGNITV